MAEAGLDSVPVHTFSFYDQVLDTAVLLGVVPDRYAGIADPLDRYFAMARGTAELAPLEMTKWFDTNYHYLVPEITGTTSFVLNAEDIVAEVAAAVADGIPARPVILGPISFLLLSKPAGSSAAENTLLDRVDELTPLYAQLLVRLAAAGSQWVQLDEPCLVQDRTTVELEAVRHVYSVLAGAVDRPGILVATYFGDPGAALPVLVDAGIDGVALDLVYGPVPTADLSNVLVVAGVVDGRNIWRTDPDRAQDLLRQVRQVCAVVAVSTSCSLLHVPYSLAPETGLDAQLTSWLAFAEEKVGEVAALAGELFGTGVGAELLTGSRAAVQDRRTAERVHRPWVQTQLQGIRPESLRRPDATLRRSLQAARYTLPMLPTTTIGSFPQTPQVRRARADLVAGRIDKAGYESQMRAEIAAVIALQEDIGLDVLVHGEPERNDMVQYFAEQLDGFATTVSGWVQSYGSRCVRPPILFGDVSRPQPMTLSWSRYAQTLTAKPVKGMLTGPVTILAWSFVRDDQPLGETARQVALAIRAETVDLERAGIGIIQVDEPALRELLPLRQADRADYLQWAVDSFRLATSGVGVTTAVHTHLCYSEFGEIVGAINDLDADVTSVEAARSHLEFLDDLEGAGYRRGIGPGVYDIHSPRVPGAEEIADALQLALKAVPAEHLWVNPDCGLKTRRPEEVEPALRNMVAATHTVRATLTARR